jgi:hypothetical protein
MRKKYEKFTYALNRYGAERSLNGSTAFGSNAD